MTELVEYIPFLFLSWLARRLRFSTAGKVGATLGSWAFALPIRRKEIALDNLARAFPEFSKDQLRRIARGAFRNYGTVLMEFLWSDGRTEEQLLETIHAVDAEFIKKHFAEPRAVILLSGHYGCWEWLVKPVRLSIGRPVTSIVYHQRNKRIDRFVDRVRCQFGNSTVPMGIGVREVLRVLRAGGVVAMLGDQSGPKESVFIDFLGRPAATHRGAAAFSLKTNTPIIMAFLLRQGDGRYQLMFEEVDRTGLGSYTEENVTELTRRHTAILERYIRMRPDLWLWMHKRWKHTEFYQSHVMAGETA